MANKRWLARIAAPAVAIPAALMLTAGVAHAHYKTIYIQTNLASISSDHKRGSVCDQESDSRAVHGQFDLDGRIVTVTDSTDNGSCVTNSFNLPAIRFRVCENTTSNCTVWHRT